MKACIRCILDINDDPNLILDAYGICNHCMTYDENILKYYKGDDKELKNFKNLINLIKKEGKGKKYEAVIGLSGGVDSTFVAYLCMKYKLRVLAVHLDNGWNSELSVVNIKNILKRTQYDLYTHVIKWAEFRDLQRSFFKANVVDIELLTDHAIGTILKRIAKKNKIKYILNGSSITTEGRLPNHWIHNKSDSLNIRKIHKTFGSEKIQTFPIRKSFSISLKKEPIKTISILDLYPYNKPKAKEIIINEFEWRDYGGKHYESIFTRFYQAYILPKKFNIDKRKSHYSTLICAGQLSRDEAIELMKEETYLNKNLETSDYNFVLKKLGFTKEEFDMYIKSPRIEHSYYGSIENYYNIIRPIYRGIKSVLKR
jgi:N-acetyl sugar amidotransferase